MRGRSAALIAFAVLLDSRPSLAADPAAVERGQALTLRLCAGCHAVGPEGASRFAPAPPLRTIAQRYDVDDLAEAFAEGIVVGHPAMPVFTFEPPEIGDLLDYLRSLDPSQTE